MATAARRGSNPTRIPMTPPSVPSLQAMPVGPRSPDPVDIVEDAEDDAVPTADDVGGGAHTSIDDAVPPLTPEGVDEQWLATLQHGQDGAIGLLMDRVQGLESAKWKMQKRMESIKYETGCNRDLIQGLQKQVNELKMLKRRRPRVKAKAVVKAKAAPKGQGGDNANTMNRINTCIRIGYNKSCFVNWAKSTPSIPIS